MGNNQIRPVINLEPRLIDAAAQINFFVIKKKTRVKQTYLLNQTSA